MSYLKTHGDACTSVTPDTVDICVSKILDPMAMGGDLTSCRGQREATTVLCCPGIVLESGLDVSTVKVGNMGNLQLISHAVLSLGSAGTLKFSRTDAAMDEAPLIKLDKRVQRLM